MRVAILGAGNIGLASTAWLFQSGNHPILWSPIAQDMGQLQANHNLLSFTGVMTGQCQPEISTDIGYVVDTADVIFICVPGYAHKTALDAIVPHLRNGQPVIINNACSLSALYLSKRLAARHINTPIITWGTTLLTARRQANGCEVAIMAIRKFVHVATLPIGENHAAIALCTALFGHRFRAQKNILATSLININPIAHLGLALCNITRIERQESWPQYHYLTPGVANLIASLEKERQLLARQFGLQIHSIEEHFQQSFDVSQPTLAEIAAELHRKRGGPPGPTTMDTRFIMEDTPYGLVFAEAVAQKAGIQLTLHSSVINVVAAIWDKDLRHENNILPELGLEDMSLAEFNQVIGSGYR